MANSLAELRQTLADLIDTAGVRAVPYVGERITPPVAVVVPGDVYVASEGEEAPAAFGMQVVRLMVLVIGSTGTNRAAAQEIDGLIETVVTAVESHSWEILSVSQPGQVELNGARFLGSVVELETYHQFN